MPAGFLVSEAVEDGMGDGTTMGEALSRWGVALLLSDTIGATEGYRLNDTYAFISGFTSDFDNILYIYGSINYYNYATARQNQGCVPESASGALHFFDSSEDIYYALRNVQHGHSNIYYLAAKPPIDDTVAYKIYRSTRWITYSCG